MDAAAFPEPDGETNAGEALRTHPLGFVIGSISGLGNAILPLGFVLYQARDEALGVALIMFVLLAIVAVIFLFSFLQWYNRTYRVGETDIRVESGVLSRNARSVPFERIQDVSLEQSLLPRLFGLVIVRFETGAGGKDELTLSYLSEEEGERLREVIRSRRDGEAATAADFGETPETPPIFAMSAGRVFTFGMFEFSLAVVAVVGGLAQQFEFLLPIDIWDFDYWRDQMAGPGSELAGLGMASQVAAGIAALASLAVLGLVTGMVRTVLRDWDFRLDRTDKGFRRRRGLLTKTDVVMPAHRVQALVQSTGIIRRIFGWHGLKFISLAQDSGSASHDVAPFAKLPEIAPIVTSAGFHMPLPDLEWQRASGRFRFDNALWIALFFAGVAGALAWAVWQFEDLPIDSRLVWIPVVLGAFLVVREVFLWRYDRHSLDGSQVYVRRGWLAPRLETASRVKLHSVHIVQGPIAQRRGYATLHLGLAGGTLYAEGLDTGRARAVRDMILRSIAERDFSELEGLRPA